LQGADLRQAKATLAYEVTKNVHGEAAAQQARAATQALFGHGPSSEAVPQIELPAKNFQHGMGVIDLFVAAGLAGSKSEARRLITQGGAYLQNRRIDAIDEKIGLNDFQEGAILLRTGKKRYQKVILSN
jgi:tyrosyl-tRNA synthetase